MWAGQPTLVGLYKSCPLYLLPLVNPQVRPRTHPSTHRMAAAKIMECISGGELFTHLRRVGGYPEKDRAEERWVRL